MSEDKDIQDFTDKERRFCEEYCIDLNATQAAIRAEYSVKSARQIGSQNLSKPYIAKYIATLQSDLSKLTGVTAARNILELKKMAFTSLAGLNKNWYELKDWNELTEEQKSAISEITQTVTSFGDSGEKKTVKLKLHDKLKAIEMLNRMLGFNAPEKLPEKKGTGQTEAELDAYIKLYKKNNPEG